MSNSVLDGKSQEEKLSILDDILRRGLRELCQHARDRDFLNYPYGRQPDPTPLITEEQFIKAGGLHCADDEPAFNFDYGFDPLQFLGNFIKWAHPDSVQQRHEAKLAAQARLVHRAEHAKTQLQVQQSLQRQVRRLQAGIAWGPLSLPLSSTGLRCAIQPFKHGILYVQLSDHANFDHVLKTYKIYMKKKNTAKKAAVEGGAEAVVEEGEEEPEMCPAQSIDFIDLEEKKTYFIRCVSIVTDEFPPMPVVKNAKNAAAAVPDRFEVKDTEEEFQAIQQTLQNNSFMHGCHTLPDENTAETSSSNKAYHVDAKTMLQLSFFGQLPVDDLLALKLPEDDEPLSPIPGAGEAPKYSCLLGDILSHRSGITNEVHYASQLRVLLMKLSALWNNFKQTSMCLAWRDNHSLSSQYLKLEEQAYKAYRHDIKKYNKKHGIDDKTGKKSRSSSQKVKELPPPPVLKRPPPSPMYSALLQSLPITSMLAEDDSNGPSCRMLYRTVMLSSEVQLILLDMRRMTAKTSLGCDYLGKEQAEWLHYVLEQSNATWKLIACGKSFGVCVVNDQDGSQKVEDEKEADFEEEVEAVPESKNADDGENEGTETRVNTATTKQVQMVVSESEKMRAKEKKLANAYDDCEETFGRSKYSLQYVLSKFHSKAEEKEKSVVLEEGMDLDRQMFVRSGIVLLTGGVASSWIHYHYDGEQAQDEFHTTTSHIGKVEDIATPPYCAAYYHLTSPITEPIALTDPSAILQTSSSAHSLPSSSKQIPYCVEVSLGSGSNEQDSSNSFQYLPGLEAKTCFVTSSSQTPTVTQCEVAVLEDGSLKVEVFQQDLSDRKSRRSLFEKNFIIPTMHSDESDDQSGSVYVA